MIPTFGLTEERINSQLAPLAALAYYWQREMLLDLRRRGSCKAASSRWRAAEAKAQREVCAFCRVLG